MSEGKEDESEIIMDILVFLEELDGTDDTMTELQAFEERCLKQFDDCACADEYSLGQQELRMSASAFEMCAYISCLILSFSLQTRSLSAYLRRSSKDS
jgi:hypothetical protein